MPKLFQDQSNEDQEIKLKINKNFQDKFNRRKEREFLEKAKIKHGKNYE